MEDNPRSAVKPTGISFTCPLAYNRIMTMTDGTGTTSYTYYPVTIGGTLGAAQLKDVIEWVPQILLRLGILPGSAGSRTLAAGAGVLSIPQGSITIPGSMGQFEPLPYPY